VSGKSGAAHGLDERVVSAVLEPMAHGKVNKKASGHPPTLPYPSSRIDSIMLGKREEPRPGCHGICQATYHNEGGEGDTSTTAVTAKSEKKGERDDCES